MSKRYQVFVSSTFADLKDERAKVIQTIMESDCIPAGMEIFPAIDEEQFNFIKSIIDDCDYYILIIGGRYGSVSEDGISYTEKEFDYAVEKGIKVLAFIHGNPDEIPFGKTEKDSTLREKLEKFKEKVSSNRLIRSWRNAEELPGLVSQSLIRTIKTYPAVGWIRANAISNPEILQELNEQRKANEELREKVSALSKLQIDDENAVSLDNIAGLDDVVDVFGNVGPYEWAIKISWRQIFYIISPYLLEYPADVTVKSKISESLYNKTEKFLTSHTPRIEDQIYQTIKIHLKVIGLVDIQYSKTVSGSMGLFWNLTEKGEKLMMEIRAVKK